MLVKKGSWKGQLHAREKGHSLINNVIEIQGHPGVFELHLPGLRGGAGSAGQKGVSRAEAPVPLRLRFLVE